jgi:hypothetical protein
VREKEKEKERYGDIGGGERKKERGSDYEGEIKRCRTYPELLFLFIKGMTGHLLVI